MAIGQLCDYRRFIDPRPRCAVLLPARPRDDLAVLLEGLGIGLVYAQEGGGFVTELL